MWEEEIEINMKRRHLKEANPIVRVQWTWILYIGLKVNHARWKKNSNLKNLLYTLFETYFSATK